MTTDTHTDPAQPAMNPVMDPAVEAWLSQGRGTALPEVGADFAALQGELQKERGLGELRSLPTAARIAFALVASLLIVLGIVAATPRADLAVLPSGRMAADLVLLGVPLVVAVSASMHPLHRPPISRLLRGLVIGLAVFVMLASVLLPPAHLDHPASLEGLGDDVIPRAFKCFAFGVAAAVPALLVVRLLGRSGRGVARFLPTMLVAAIAVLVGCFGLYLHCPITAPQHLIAGHATVWLSFAAVALLFGRRTDDG